MRLRAALAAAAALVLALAGCGGPAENKPLHRSLAVTLPQQFATSDPAYSDDEGSDTLVYHVYQRLLSVQPGSNEPKRDAAECKFIDEVTYTCMLRKGLFFAEGERMNTDHVKFSLERARRLARPGSPGRMLDTIAEMKIMTDRRIDFVLKAPDHNIAYALASPAASIVHPEDFPADGPRAPFVAPNASGPYNLEYHDIGHVRLKRNARYGGYVWPQPPSLVLRSATDPATDRLGQTGQVDVLWGIPGDLPPGFETTTIQHGEASRLEWNPQSPLRADEALRHYVRDATAPLRTQTSNRPAPLKPQPAEFPRDARATPPAGQYALTLGHPKADARAAKLADSVAAELRKAPGVTVTLRPGEPGSDLWLTFDHTPTAGLLPTLQHWTDFPLPGREARIGELVAAHRRARNAAESDAAATALLREAAADATLVPLTQNDLTIGVRKGLTIERDYDVFAGPNFQLGGWELRW